MQQGLSGILDVRLLPQQYAVIVELSTVREASLALRTLNGMEIDRPIAAHPLKACFVEDSSVHLPFSPLRAAPRAFSSAANPVPARRKP